MFENILNNNIADSSSADFITNTATAALQEITAGQFFTCIAFTIVLGFLISAVYMFTHRKQGYAQSYVMTIIMLPSVVALILLLIHTTAGALSLAGAFTLVRFRSAPGDPKDITYVFYAMATGVACGIGYVGYAAVFFLLFAVILIVIDIFKIGETKKNHMTLKITIPENLDYKGVFDPVLQRYTSYYKLRRIKTTNFGTLFELIYSVDVYDDIDTKKFIDEIRTLNGNLTVNLVFFKYDDKIYES